jgi:phospholipid/cholesterol/gamma-HCH transport system ATP-binding protein
MFGFGSNSVPAAPAQDAPSACAGQSPQPLICFEHVSIAFDGRAVLRDVSFSVNRGETLCILGRSGVGKSVALRLMLGFLKPDHGRIRIGDDMITELNEDGLRRVRQHVTMVFQNGALFDSMSVRENVAFPLREQGGRSEDEILEKADELIALVGAEDAVDLLPASLSTGRKRAVAIARALAANPDIVLYDEPTTMVDPLIARRLGDLIERLKQERGFTSIVVTHDMRFARRLADQVLFLDKGEARFFGSLEDFLAQNEPTIRKFLELDDYTLPMH